METLRHVQDLIAKEELYLQSCGYVRSRQLGALLRKEKALYRAFNRAESLTQEILMENRDEMLEAIMVILETYDDEYIRHIFEVLTDTVH